MTYSYSIKPRGEDQGGGWRLMLLEDGIEVGGGLFPPDGYSEAMIEAEEWLFHAAILKSDLRHRSRDGFPAIKKMS